MAHKTDLAHAADKGIPRDPRIFDPKERMAFLSGIAEGRILPGATPQALVTQILAAELVALASRRTSGKRKTKGNGNPF